MNKIVIFGLDGASFNIINPLIRGRKMPNLKKLIDNGIASELESAIPPWTAVAWASLFTGRNPGKHGVFNFMKRLNSYSEWELVNSEDIHSRCIYDYLTEQNLFSIILNVPMTYPPRKINGILIPGFMAPEDPESYPKGILNELKRKIGDYRVYSKFEANERAKPSEVLEGYLETARMRRDAALYLAGRYKWDFMFVQFQETDSIFHRLNDFDKISWLFEKVDEYIGDILMHIEKACNVFVVSDHGMGKYDGWTFYVNRWLQKQGFLKTKIGYPTRFKKRMLGIHRKQSLATTFFAELRKIGLTLNRIERLFSIFKLERCIKKVMSHRSILSFISNLRTECVDYDNSRAFCPFGECWGIQINADHESAETIKEEIKTKLRTIKDHEGRTVFEKVYDRNEIYEGNYVENAPDLILIPKDMNYEINERLSNNLFSRKEDYDHKIRGLLIASGPDIKNGKLENIPSIVDIAPTILYALNTPIDPDMDGEVLMDIFKDSFRDQKPTFKEYPKYKLHSKKKPFEEEEIMNRLKRLGYL